MPRAPWYCCNSGTTNGEKDSECTFCYHIKCDECPFFDSRTGIAYYGAAREDLTDLYYLDSQDAQAGSNSEEYEKTKGVMKDQRAEVKEGREAQQDVDEK